MSTTQERFLQAQLAEAGYANVRAADGSLTTADASVIDALKAEGLSESQAAQFVIHWRVVDHLSDEVQGESMREYGWIQFPSATLGGIECEALGVDAVASGHNSGDGTRLPGFVRGEARQARRCDPTAQRRR